jgi:hypothetical protein
MGALGVAEGDFEGRREAEVGEGGAEEEPQELARVPLGLARAAAGGGLSVHVGVKVLGLM